MAVGGSGWELGLEPVTAEEGRCVVRIEIQGPSSTSPALTGSVLESRRVSPLPQFPYSAPAPTFHIKLTPEQRSGKPATPSKGHFRAFILTDTVPPKTPLFPSLIPHPPAPRRKEAAHTGQVEFRFGIENCCLETPRIFFLQWPEKERSSI